MRLPIAPRLEVKRPFSSTSSNSTSSRFMTGLVMAISNCPRAAEARGYSRFSSWPPREVGPASGHRYRLHLDLPGGVGEAADDQRARRLALAERFLPSRAAGREVGGIRQDGDDLHDIVERHLRRPELGGEIGPDEATLRHDVVGDVAVGIDADLPADVERARGAGHFDGLAIGADRRGRVDVAASHGVVSVAAGAGRAVPHAITGTA